MGGTVVNALLLTAAAGLATTIGSGIAMFVKKPSNRFMGFTLGFSAGVMILVSFVELLQKSIQTIGFLYAHISFFSGMVLFFLIDNLLPHDYLGEEQHSGPLMRTGLLIAIGIGIHNFPEGMATFVGAVEDIKLGTAIAIAIALHNIPEGLAVAAPVLKATGSRRKAFLWSFLSGVSEPVGAAFAAVVLFPFLNATVLGWVLAAVGGIMVAISLDELIPVAKSFDMQHTPIMGVMTGMLVMALSLYLLV